MTSSQTTSFFHFTHVSSLFAAVRVCRLFMRWQPCTSTFAFCHCYFILSFLSSTTHPCVCSSINSSIHSLRTETKVQLYCPVYGEHATIVFVQSFYASPPHFISFPSVFYLYFMQLYMAEWRLYLSAVWQHSGTKCHMSNTSNNNSNSITVLRTAEAQRLSRQQD